MGHLLRIVSEGAIQGRKARVGGGRRCGGRRGHRPSRRRQALDGRGDTLQDGQSAVAWAGEPGLRQPQNRLRAGVMRKGSKGRVQG